MMLALGTFLSLAALSCAKENFIDHDTPEDKRTTKSLVDGSVYHLVMSDEFNVENRSFTDGHDALWTALDKSDDDFGPNGGGSLHFYNSTTVTTKDGMLKISSIVGTTEWSQYDTLNKTYKDELKNFKSGMVQGWDKFCFTGGIVEVDVILPGDPFVGGLWPAVWMLGNLGRATYERSTNRIWPWSFDTCDRDQQSAQLISGCNVRNHYGLNPGQGRGATEIDIIEVVAGEPGDLPGTDPTISKPYSDMTLQVAPGVAENRPSEGQHPKQHRKNSHGYPVFSDSVWYDELEMNGNTSLNIFHYGTFLGETKKGEPVSRNKYQAFQTDAVGAMHQITPAHFKKVHTLRLEWQPGRDGRLDWFLQGYKKGNETIEGDGMGKDWYNAFSIKDESLKNVTGSQIPAEPSYLIFNTAISQNWAWKENVPDWCKPCFDCHDRACACNFPDGFCNMMIHDDVAMKIDSVRVYQSKDPKAHPGQPHTLGCDLLEFPSKEFIQGNKDKYSRDAPFNYHDLGPLRKIQKGGHKCKTDADCGGGFDDESERVSRGKCGKGIEYVDPGDEPFFRFTSPLPTNVCKCNDGFTGPKCLSIDHKPIPGAYDQKRNTENMLFEEISSIYVPKNVIVVFCTLMICFIFFMVQSVSDKRKRLAQYKAIDSVSLKEYTGNQKVDAIMTITGRSV